MNFNKKRKKNKNYDPFIIQEGKYKDGHLKSGYRFNWTEEVFAPLGSGEETVGKNFDFKKISKISFLLAFFLLLILTRVAWLQIARGEYYYGLAEGNRIRVNRIEAKRGVIHDSNMQPLVRNVANFLLYFTPSDLPKNEDEKNNIINRVSSILEDDISNEEIKEKLKKIKPYSLESYQPLFIEDNIEYEKAMLLYLESSNMPGVVLLNKTRREYLESDILSLSHIMGYTGKINEEELSKLGDEYLPIDYVGKMGIEYFWENELKGIGGNKQVEVDALGKEKKIISQEDPQDGHDLILSLNIDLQKKLEDTIAESLKKLKLNKAAAIVMNPNNGEILAMVSMPSYNNNSFAVGMSSEEYKNLISDPDNPLFNRCISGEYPSGSTFKPIVAVAALEEGIINENTSFNSVGGIRIDQWFFPDWKAGGHGRTNVRRAIAESINTFFYYIGGGYNDFTGLGVDKIVHYGKLFGLNAQSGIDLAGEVSGFLPSKEWKEEIKGERWYVGDTYHLAIGQGDILVTPLQVANFTSVFANGGSLYQPHLIHKILVNNKKEEREIEAVPIRSDFIDSYNIEVVRQGMRRTVTNGSAQSLQLVSVEVAGKTGTAQWSSDGTPHAWFTGFAPYDNPEIVITILIEEGNGGDVTAVPIAREVLTWYFNNN
ncbi:MAG: penicillin-binding protein 2 [Candidatus Falkowbacteria bacterium]